MKFIDRGSLITHLKKLHTDYSVQKVGTRGGSQNDQTAIQFFQKILENPVPANDVQTTIPTRLAPPTTSNLAASIAEAEKQLQNLKDLLAQTEQSANVVQTEPIDQRKRKRSSTVVAGEGEDEDSIGESDNSLIVPIKVPRYKSKNIKKGIVKGEVSNNENMIKPRSNYYSQISMLAEKSFLEKVSQLHVKTAPEKVKKAAILACHVSIGQDSILRKIRFAEVIHLSSH